MVHWQEAALVVPLAQDWSSLRLSDLLKLQFDGALLEGEGVVGAAEFWTHVKLHNTRPNTARCVLSAQPPHATMLATALHHDSARLRMIHHSFLRFFNSVEYDLEACSPELLADPMLDAEHVSNKMRQRKHRVLVRHRRGIVVAGSSVADAFDTLVSFEKACELQAAMMQTPWRTQDLDDLAMTDEQCEELVGLVSERDENNVYSEMHLAMLHNKLGPYE